jgi:hypothetical protein
MTPLLLLALLSAVSGQDGLTSALRMADQLTDPQIAAFRDHRDGAAEPGARTVLTRELITVMRSLGRLFRLFDRDTDGLITAAEFQQVTGQGRYTWLHRRQSKMDIFLAERMQTRTNYYRTDGQKADLSE